MEESFAPAWPGVALLLAYLVIPAHAPHLQAIDGNAARFLGLALLNLVALAYLLLRGRRRREHPAGLQHVARTWIGLACAGWLVLTLLSIAVAVNRHEALLHGAKIASVVVAVMVLGALFRSDRRLVRLAAIVLTGLLLVDAVRVMHAVGGLAGGEIASLVDIKLRYGNKNILAATLFVKMAGAVWLFAGERGPLRAVAWVSLLAGLAAILVLAARAFQVGLLAVAMVLLIGTLALWWRERRARLLLPLGGFLAALLIAGAAVSFIQARVLPSYAPGFTTANGGARLTAPLLQQSATITPASESARLRFLTWRWSWQMIRERPLLGVGAGNWKIHAVSHENRHSPGLFQAHKAHNDFLEIAAETGVGGGLLYLAVFLLAGGSLLVALRRRDRDPRGFRLHALAAGGLFSFGVDACFNFPHDRPEMMVLFAVFVAMSAAGSQPRGRPAPAAVAAPGVTVALLLLTALAIPALLLNLRSGQAQRVAFSELRAGQLRQPADAMLNRLPSFPNLTGWGESTRVLAARYLHVEGRHREVIATLRTDRASPFDARREHLMALAFLQLGEPDSALRYTAMARGLKPYFLETILLEVNLLEERGRTDEAIELLDRYLAQESHDLEARLTLARLHHGLGDHSAAIGHLDQVLEVAPGDLEALALRAFCHYHLGRHQSSLDDLNRALGRGARDPELLNLRGACHESLSDLEAACRDYAAAMAAGNDHARVNHARLCGEGG